MIVTISELMESLSKFPGDATVKVSMDGIRSDVIEVAPAIEKEGKVTSVSIVAFPEDSE